MGEEISLSTLVNVLDGCDASACDLGICDRRFCVLHTRLKVIGGGVGGPQQQSVSIVSGLQHVQDGSSIHLNPSDKTHANIIMSDISNNMMDILKLDSINTSTVLML